MRQHDQTQLTAPQRAVLEQAALFGITLPEASHSLSVLKGSSESETRRLFQQLCRRELLVAAWLYHGRRCFHLTQVGATAAGIDQRNLDCDGCPVSEETKIRRFAMLAFCCLGTVPRTVLRSVPSSAAEKPGSANAFPWGFYVQPQPTPLIGFLRVDMGGRGRWDRILAKCQDDARRMVQRCPPSNGGEPVEYEVTIATALPQKAERLRAAFSNTLPIPIRIAVIPELLNLIVPPFR